MYKFICTTCGYIFEGNKSPQHCPNCKASDDKFDKINSNLKWKEEHKLEILEEIRSTFISECMEVGIYLAMGHQADREGYPEIAKAFKSIAYEEGEHAARFAEILGELVVEDTKINLKTRAEAEYEATDGKLKIARKAKVYGLDSIHDIVHKMCKEEAKHGKIFAELIERYFEDND